MTMVFGDAAAIRDYLINLAGDPTKPAPVGNDWHAREAHSGRLSHQLSLNVANTAFIVASAVLWRADPDSIECRGHEGRRANVVWFKVGGKRYCAAFNHGTGMIELQDRTIGDPVLHAWDDHLLRDILPAFRSLRGQHRGLAY